MRHSMQGKNARHAPSAACQPAKAAAVGAMALASSFGGLGVACAQPGVGAGVQPPQSTYSTKAPDEQYMAKSPADEIALASSAAPPSISADAKVLVLGRRGYETAVEGKNGFVCFVQRSWAAGFDDAEFWNPRVRAPNCFNAPAARTELPQYLKRTEWVMAGVTKQEMIDRTRRAVADQSFRSPEPGAFSFMLSKIGYVNDQAGGPWYPHVMFFIPHGQAAVWGAGLEGSPILGQEGSEIESTVLFIPVRRWSDGSPATPTAKQHTHTN